MPGSTKPLVVVGSLNVDLHLHIPHLPAPGETQLATAVTRSPGGKGANQAVAAARLGACTGMLGCIGDDADGQTLLDALDVAGVDTAAVARCAQPTGTATILLTPSGENSIVVAPGANHAFTPAHLQQHAGLLAGAGMLLAQLETPLTVLDALLALATQAGVPVLLDPAPAAPLPPAVLRQLAWFTPNETEARLYAGDHPAAALRTLKEARTLCGHFHTLGPRNILLKLGGHGACVLSEQGEWLHAPAPRVQVVDTTGAGDTLNAAFATALLRGEPLQAALRFAVAAASLSTTRAGAMESAPTREQVEVLLTSAI